MKNEDIIERWRKLGSFRPLPEHRRMQSVGDVYNARKSLEQRRGANLKVLLRDRYSWMQPYIREDGRGVEVGCGAGWSRHFLKAKSIYLTDYADYDFLDVRFVDAMHLPFRDNSLDFVIAVNVIHHLAFPTQFIEGSFRALRPGGVLLIAEPHASTLMRGLLRLMAHEGYDFTVDPFQPGSMVVDSVDPWIGNNATVRLLFDDHQRFHQHVPGWRIEVDEIAECLLFVNSGGVTAKTYYVPLPTAIVELMGQMDRITTGLFPNTLGLLRKVALRKPPIP